MKRRKDLTEWAGDAEHRNEFVQKNHDKFGRDLEASLEQSCQEVHSRRTSAAFVGTGEFMDSPGLHATYAKKPLRLEGIRQNTKVIACPLSGVRLYEDLKFTSRYEDSETLDETNKRTLTATSTSKKAKKQKVDKVKVEDAKKEGSGVANKKISPKQVEQIKKWQATLETATEKLGEAAVEIAKVKEALPPYAVRCSNESKALLEGLAAKLEMAVDAGECDFKTLKSEYDTTKSSNQKTMTMLLQMLDAAQQFADK